MNELDIIMDDLRKLIEDLDKFNMNLEGGKNYEITMVIRELVSTEDLLLAAYRRLYEGWRYDG